jgi:hypothetical protein
MRLVTSANRWISVFATEQTTAIVRAWNVMNSLLSRLETQEGRMTCHGRYVGTMRPAFAKMGKPCQRPIHPVLVTGNSQDRQAIRSR